MSLPAAELARVLLVLRACCCASPAPLPTALPAIASLRELPGSCARLDTVHSLSSSADCCGAKGDFSGAACAPKREARGWKALPLSADAALAAANGAVPAVAAAAAAGAAALAACAWSNKGLTLLLTTTATLPSPGPPPSPPLLLSTAAFLAASFLRLSTMAAPITAHAASASTATSNPEVAAAD